MKEYHRPVLLNEVIEFLKCRRGGIYVDATIGGGGYAEAILKSTNFDSRIIGLDRDEEALAESRKRLKDFEGKVTFIKANFSEIEDSLKNIGEEEVDGIVADLGVSSHQFDDAERGFSFSKDAPLDMRMDQSSKTNASDLINDLREKELADLFFELGGERFSRRIARAVIKEREKGAILSTGGLSEIVTRAYPSRVRHGRIHPATRVFQALRIKVNEELKELEGFVGSAPHLLKRKGRLVIVSYHSLEDRIVKRTFLSLSQEEAFIRITKKPVKPAQEEIENNKRARSARLRVLERAD